MLYVQTIFLGGMPHHYRTVSISVKTCVCGSYMDKTSISLPIALCYAISGFLFRYNIDAILFQPLLNINMISWIISYPTACYKLSFFRLLATIEMDFPIQFCLQVWNRNANTSNLFERTSKTEVDDHLLAMRLLLIWYSNSILCGRRDGWIIIW